MKYPIFAAGVLMATMAGAEVPVLTVYTYDSFISDWGPGPQIETAFEAECGCDVQFVGAGDGAALLGRLRLEGVRTRADVVVGLDTNLTAAAAATGLFAPLEMDDVALDLPVEWQDDMFVPYDWGYFAFVYDKVKLPAPPKNFIELAAASPDLKIVIQDPRSSTPGLGLLLWVKAAYGNGARAIWDGLAPHILTVTKGWSEAYGLFLEGEADMVLSYTTSPAYHLIAEDDDTKAAAAFEEGHYMQIEVAGRIASSNHAELSKRFLRFLLSDAAQAILPVTNWMYPAVLPPEGLPEGFETLITPEQALIYPAGDAAAIRDEALAEWRDALSQ